MASAQKGPVSRRRPSASLPRRRVPGRRPRSPFPELADRAVCSALGRIPGALAWEAASPGPTSTNTDRPPQSASRRGAGTAALGHGERELLVARAADVGLPRATALCAGGGGPGSGRPPGAAGLGAKAAASAGSERGSLLPGEGEVLMSGNSLECRRALCDSHGRGPKATSRQMGKSAFLCEHEKFFEDCTSLCPVWKGRRPEKIETPIPLGYQVWSQEGRNSGLPWKVHKN